jgi:predicted DNA-binding transcriptional regulator YafY
MSKQEAVSRYNLIIRKLRNHPADFAEIAHFLEVQSEIEGYNFKISKRTFQRDVKDIYSIYKIDIQYNFSDKVYYIDNDDQPEANERILEAFDTFNALNISDRLSDHIHFEKRKPQGTENLYGLLHAIKTRVQIRFSYLKYWEGELTHRLAEPLALKEFKNRWYILAKDLKDNKVKSFALDRLSSLEITKKHFDVPEDFNMSGYYRHCFGIVGPNGQEPQEVILSFVPFEGKFIKSLPLHDSQEILVDDEEELRLKLKLVLTHDFLMEVMSHGDNVRVIAPDKLVKEVKAIYRNALNQYKDE